MLVALASTVARNAATVLLSSRGSVGTEVAASAAAAAAAVTGSTPPPSLSLAAPLPLPPPPPPPPPPPRLPVERAGDDAPDDGKPNAVVVADPSPPAAPLAWLRGVVAPSTRGASVPATPSWFTAVPSTASAAAAMLALADGFLAAAASSTLVTRLSSATPMAAASAASRSDR